MAEVDPDITSALKKLTITQSGYVIGVDVGGTNTRVAVGTPDGEYVIVAKFLSRTVTQLKSGLEKLVGSVVNHLGRAPDAACMAIAGPISEFGTVGEVTNYEGVSNEERTIRVKDLSPANFPHATTRFVNDLESCCYGVLALDNQKLLGEYFSSVWETEGNNSVQLKPSVHHAVLAAGTGLGCGMLIKLGNNKFQVYPIEYGHALLSPLGVLSPNRELDERLSNYLSEKLYEGKFPPEYEDVVSGRGIGYVYDFLVQGKTDCPSGLSAAEIVFAATNNPPNKYAVQALVIHYRILMRAAQNIAVGLQAKGILLAGDNQVANDPFFRSITKELKSEFLNHPKRHWIENVPVYAQTKLFNINLFGTLFVARSLSASSSSPPPQ